MFPFSPSSIQQQKEVYNCGAKDVGVVYNEWINLSHVLQVFVKLHPKAAELCLTSS